MSWQLVRLQDQPARPWRNGGGTTRELLAWPHSADWSCRFSVAEVTQNGPFSRFEGVQRWFAVLSGAGVRLTLANQSVELNCNSAPFHFDGALPVDCDLLGGPTQDFNLMVREPAGLAEMRRVSGLFKRTLEASKLVAIFAMDKGAEVFFGEQIDTLPGGCLAWQLAPPGVVVSVNAANALWLEVPL